MRGWQAVTPNETDGTHVVPTNDAFVHSLDGECVCGPAPELIETGDGNAWMYTHRSLDGREANEHG